eukprot:SAG31_NODE_1363_length_8627_cov_5.967402_3_plen_231_part_00
MPQELAYGFRVSGCPVESLNAAYEPCGDWLGYPLYRAINNGAQGLYFYKETKSWFMYARFSAEQGKGLLCVSFFVQLFEKYGTLIERYTALIEKASPCIDSEEAHGQLPGSRPLRCLPRALGRADLVGNLAANAAPLYHILAFFIYIVRSTQTKFNNNYTIKRRQCYEATDTWPNKRLTVTPLTAAEIEATEVAEIEAMASMRAGMFEQAHGVRMQELVISHFGVEVAVT